MGAIIFEISALSVVVAFVIFLAYDDYKNKKIREEEDRQKAKVEKDKTGQNSSNE